MAREWSLYGLLLLILLLIFGIVQMPASWLQFWIPKLSPMVANHSPSLSKQSKEGGTKPLSPIRFIGLQGTVFSGRAHAIIIQEHQFGPLNWQWQPTQLLFGRLAFETQLQQRGLAASGKLAITLTENALLITNLSLDADAASINPALEGKVYGRIESLEWTQQATQIHGRLIWSQAASPLAPEVSGGDIIISANGGDRLNIATNPDSSADLSLQGESSLNQGQLHYQLKLTSLTPRGREAISPLRILGNLGLRVSGIGRFGHLRGAGGVS